MVAGPVAGGPPLGMEPAGPEPGHAGQQLVDRGIGEHPQHRGVGEGGVGEVDRPQVGPLAGQFRPHQGQVIVLDQDPSALGGHGRHPLGEQPVVQPVGLPRLGEPPVGPGSPGRVEEVVVAEPQGGVGDHVVGHPIDVRLRVDELDAEPFLHHEPLVGGLSVGVAQGTGHPGGPGAGHHRVQGPGQPTGSLASDQPAVGLLAERERAPVGHHHQVVKGPSGFRIGRGTGHAAKATRIAEGSTARERPIGPRRWPIDNVVIDH